MKFGIFIKLKNQKIEKEVDKLYNTIGELYNEVKYYNEKNNYQGTGLNFLEDELLLMLKHSLQINKGVCFINYLETDKKYSTKKL